VNGLYPELREWLVSGIPAYTMSRLNRMIPSRVYYFEAGSSIHP
jgi:hypothetical protein